MRSLKFFRVLGILVCVLFVPVILKLYTILCVHLDDVYIYFH